MDQSIYCTGLKGGHIILLNSADSEYFQATKAQAMLALDAYPGGLQIGGGVNPDNAADYLAAGASHVIVTSYVFRDGHISWKNLEKMVDAAGKEHLVLDLSCRKKEDAYYVVTDRTYAGGVGSMEDIQTLKMAAGGKVDVTVGSALDLFGGTIPFVKLIGNL